jgi:hypothetical protein
MITKTTNITRVVDIPHSNDIAMNDIETSLKLLAREVGTGKKSTPVF